MSLACAQLKKRVQEVQVQLEWQSLIIFYIMISCRNVIIMHEGEMRFIFIGLNIINVVPKITVIWYPVLLTIMMMIIITEYRPVYMNIIMIVMPLHSLISLYSS